MAWLSVLVGALILLGIDSAQKLVAFRAATTAGEQGRPAPAIEANSPTGYADGRRNQILQSTDGYQWVMQTQQMIATGDWRVREVKYDNAPAGREVHWCSPIHWWLAAVAWGDHVITGRSWPVAVEHAALYAGPVLLALFLIGLVPWAARRFGLGSAALLAAGFVLIAPLSGEFGAGSYDHHGVAAACALLSVLFLLAGWQSPANARGSFIAAGIAGAAGLWVNAATQIPVLAGIGVGGWWAHRLARDDAAVPDPRCWRTWGWAGGAASLVFYLIEYFPAHLGWRLEVNHPVYALAWAGAGDWLARLTSRRGESRPPSSHDRVMAVTSAVAVVLPPLVMGLAPRTFTVSDPFLWTLHVDYISEFSPLFGSWPGFADLLVRVTVLPLVGLAALWLIWRGRLSPVSRAQVAIGLPAAALVTMLAWSQQRWVHVESALWLAVLVATLVSLRDAGAWTPARRAVAGIFLAAVFLPYPLRAGLDTFRPAGLFPENIRQFAVRDLAFWLRRRTGTDPVVVLTGPTATTELVYHGGFRGVGTLYWENCAGLRSMVDILGATDPAQALTQLQARGVTHVVLLPWGSFANESARLARGLRATDPVPTNAFGRELLESGRGLPDWLRPLPYRLPDAEQFKNQFALVLEVVPQQGAAEAAVRRAQFLAAMGDHPAAAQLIRQVLTDHPDEVLALITLAQLQRAARDRNAHAAMIQHLLPLLRTNPPLEPADHVALAFELTAARAIEAARAVLVRGWTTFQPADVRRLAPESLAMLLRATHDLQVQPNAELLTLANRIAAGDSTGTKR